MDEEENQEELANRKVSQGKVQKKLFIFTDEEDSAEEAGSNSEGSVGSRQADEAEEDRDEDEEDSDGCPEREDSVSKGVEAAAAAGVPAQLLDLSSDDEAEKCPICLHSFQEQPVATPSGCQHHFCLDCILEWSKNVNSCPVDRIPFSSIQLRKCHGGKVQKTFPVQEPVKVEEEEINVDFEQTSCEVCGRRDREDRLLLCDGCDAGYHIECLTPPLDAVPVEEWFCPECTSNNPHTDSAEEVSEDEVAALTDAVPTASRLRTSSVGRTRSIARTGQSERVRATVNRNRITQARAIQPRYLIQSTWLDETISAVLNSPACTRRGRTGEKHRKTQRKKAGRESSSSSSSRNSKNRTKGKDLKLHRGHTRSTKLEQKQAMKKDPAHHSRITKGSTTGKPQQSPPTRPLGSHPKSGPASLSIYDPLDLDLFDDESSVEGSPPLMDISRRGLSHSALRSHQPVARPIQHGQSRRSISISEGDMMEDSAPVPDLLGSILSGQSLLLMNSTTMVINRDGSLKLAKPACESSLKTSISSHTNTYEFKTEVQVGMASPSGLNGDPESFHYLPQITSSSHSFPGPSSSSDTPTFPLTPNTMPGNANVCSTNLAPEKPSKVYMPHPVNHVSLSQRSKTSTSSPSLPLRHTKSMSDWASREKGVGSGMGTVKQVPLNPLWLDVSRLPRIPKIRRGADRGTSPQGVNQEKQGRAETNRRQKQDRAGTSCTSSSSSSWTSGLNPSSSSTGSFCISALRQTRCPTSPKGQVTSLGSMENRLSEKQSWNIQDPFHGHLIGSHLLGSEGVPEGETLNRHAKGMMPEEKAVVPYVSGCNSNNADCQTKSDTIEVVKERNKYLGYGENMKMKRLCSQNLLFEGKPTICNSRADVAKKCRSHNMLSSQKQDSSLHSEKNKSKPKDQHSGSSSCSVARGKSDPDGRGKLKDCHGRSGGPDGSWKDTETKRKSREVTGSCSHSKEKRRVCSSSESSLSESPERPRKRCSPHRWSHSNRGHPSRNGVPSKRDECRNRKGSENQEFPQPRSRSRSRDRKKDLVKTQSSCSSKDKSRSKDGKRLRSRSLSREKKTEKDSSHSSHSTESSQRTNSSASPTNMENNEEPVSLKYPKDLTEHEEMEQGKQFSSSVMSKVLKLRREKKASLSGVEEEISAYAFHDEKGKNTTKKKEKNKEKNKEKEQNGKREIKPDPELKNKTRSRTKESLPATDPKKRPKEIFVECTKYLSADYTLNSLHVRSPDKAEATETAYDKGKTVITDAHETVGDLEAAMITGTSETVGDMTVAMITDTSMTVSGMDGGMITETFETLGAMGTTVITDTPEAVDDMENSVITDTPETAGDTDAVDDIENSVITDTPETAEDTDAVDDMESSVITDTPETAGDTDAVDDMENSVITDTPKTTGDTNAVDDMENSVITDTPETAGDTNAAVITDSPETDGDVENSVITEASENVGQMEGAVITDTPDTIGDSESAVNIGTSETTGDMESIAISAVPKIVGDVGDAKIMDKPVVKQEGHPALKPAVITAFSTISRRPVKRVTWSLQALDAPPIRMLPPNTLSHGSKDGPEIPASSSQVQDMKKMHLQERAIEEVKLAIRPFFQKKEITKDEYKEIWGKAVQKICHSKCGEISPERVASLVKAYVEKYKFLKKQLKNRHNQELQRGTCDAHDGRSQELQGGTCDAHDGRSQELPGGTCDAHDGRSQELQGGTCDAHVGRSQELQGGTCDAHDGRSQELQGGTCDAHDGRSQELQGGTCDAHDGRSQELQEGSSDARDGRSQKLEGTL